MAKGDEYELAFRHLRQAGLSKQATEAILDLVMPAAEDGTRYKLAVVDGAPTVVALDT